MVSAKIISLMGIAIELGGFAILAIELVRTNADVVAYAKSLGNKTATATTIVGSDGSNGTIEFTGGQLGAMAPAAELLAFKVAGGKTRTWIGLGTTGLGVLFQFFGTWLG